MKKILFGLLVLISFNALGQNPPGYQHRTVRERINGSFMVDSTQHVPRYCGTPSGVRGGGSVQDGAVAIDTCNSVYLFYSEGEWRNAGSLNFETRILAGGRVTWDSLLVFSVSPATYYINGVFYTSSQTGITLDAAHATLDRIDLIYIGSSGVNKVTGTAAATPAEPDLPINSIRLTAIQVPATATVPGGGIDTLTIYDQNVEWTGSVLGTTGDFDDFTSPFHFTKAASIGSFVTSDHVKFTATSPISLTNYKDLTFYIKLKATFSNSTSIRIFWSNGSTITSALVDIKIGAYGFSRTSTVYQKIVIPMSDFGLTNASADGLTFRMIGTNASGFYLDWIQLNVGITQTPNGLSNAYARMTDGSTISTAAGDDVFKFRASLPLRSVVTNNDATHGDNVLQSIDTSMAYNPSLSTNLRLQKIADSLGAIVGTKTTLAAVKALGKSKGFFLESPTSADAVDMWQTPVAITVTSLKAILRGSSPSVTYNIKFGTDITSATDVFTADITCTSITTGCSNNSGFNDATIPAGSFIWIVTTAASGTITSIAFTLNYTED